MSHLSHVYFLTILSKRLMCCGLNIALFIGSAIIPTVRRWQHSTTTQQQLRLSTHFRQHTWSHPTFIDKMWILLTPITVVVISYIIRVQNYFMFSLYSVFFIGATILIYNALCRYLLLFMRKWSHWLGILGLGCLLAWTHAKYGCRWNLPRTYFSWDILLVFLLQDRFIYLQQTDVTFLHHGSVIVYKKIFQRSVYFERTFHNIHRC